MRIVRSHPGRQLPAILNVLQHPRNQSRHLIRPLFGAQRAGFAAGQVVNRGNAAFVKQVAHRMSFWLVAEAFLARTPIPEAALGTTAEFYS